VVNSDRREYLRRYQKEWLRNRRSAWLEENGPCARCGSKENLHIDHIDPDIKIDHRVWSWKKERRDLELSKCQVLCRSCHHTKTSEDNGWRQHGAAGYARGCRCDLCTTAKVIEVNEYRWKYGIRKKQSTCKM